MIKCVELFNRFSLIAQADVASLDAEPDPMTPLIETAKLIDPPLLPSRLINQQYFHKTIRREKNVRRKLAKRFHLLLFICILR